MTPRKLVELFDSLVIDPVIIVAIELKEIAIPMHQRATDEIKLTKFLCRIYWALGDNVIHETPITLGEIRKEEALSMLRNAVDTLNKHRQ